MKKRWMTAIGTVVISLGLLACGATNDQTTQTVDLVENPTSTQQTLSETTTANVQTVEETAEETMPNVIVQFGNEGHRFLIQMEQNATAVELVRNIGNAGRNLPIYDYDNFEGWEYFQYYDIPSRYEIPSNPVTITSAKAGEVYYSDPNRVILFYQDAEISGEYTKVGEIEDIEGLQEAVEKNPVLEGWGNKLILLRYAE